MRRVLVAGLMVAGLLVAPTGASAAIDAAAFAADCNDDGFVAITANTTVRGGSGSINVLCVVSMDAGTRLRIVDASLNGTGELIFSGTLAGSTLRVVRSTIDLGGAVQLAAGCCSGEESIDESSGTVVVRDSAITGASVEVSGSTADVDGAARVVRSTLEATGPFGVIVRTSAGGSTRVIDSTLTSAGDIAIESGARTVARDNLFSAAGTTTITSDGSCASVGNTPPTPCS